MASVRQDNRDLQYHVYVTDVLQVIAENTGYTSGAIAKHGKAPKKRYAEVLSKTQPKAQEKPERSGSEIAAGIIGGLKK